MATKKSISSGAQVAHIIAPKDLELSQEQSIKVSPVGFSQCVRALRQNWRQGTVGCKDRSEVAFSNRKPWKQKGTGRARAGSARSPLWRKGGVTFGPQPRSRKLTVTKELKRSVFNNLLWYYLNDKRIVSLDWTPNEAKPKTNLAYSALKNAGLDTKKLIIFVTENDKYTHASFANIPNVQLLLFDQPNAYDLANGENWIFLAKDREAFKEMVSKWI